MKILKKTLAVILCLCLLSGLSVCFAADTEKKYLDYKSYVLLGDSVASGWSDVEEIESRFVRVEGSYGAYLADDLGVEEYHPIASVSEQLKCVISSKKISNPTVSSIIQSTKKKWTTNMLPQ